MPITDYAEYKQKVSAPTQRLQDTKVATTTVIGRAASLWLTTPFAGAIPTTAATCDNTLLGGFGQLNGSSTQRISQVSTSLASTAYVMIVDRLVHSGGLDATLTSAQAVNTPALPRYTSGVGVYAALEVYTQVGTTATTATIAYTNTSNVSKTCEVIIGGTALREVSRFIICPLAVGDAGVKSVESVTLAGTTGTAGNFGVTLFEPLFFMPVPNLGSQQLLFDSMLNCCGNCPVVQDGACLSYVVVAGSAGTGIMQSNIRFIEA